jgi:hypothetical protein
MHDANNVRGGKSKSSRRKILFLHLGGRYEKMHRALRQDGMVHPAMGAVAS